MPEVPESLRQYIARSYSEDELRSIEKDSWSGESNGMDCLEFAKDFLCRPAAWLEAGSIELNLQQKNDLANFVASVAPGGIIELRTSTMWEGRQGIRYKQTLLQNFPAAYQLIFG